MPTVSSATSKPADRFEQLKMELAQLKASGYKGKPLTEAQKAKLFTEPTPVQKSDIERAKLRESVSGF